MQQGGVGYDNDNDNGNDNDDDNDHYDDDDDDDGGNELIIICAPRWCTMRKGSPQEGDASTRSASSALPAGEKNHLQVKKNTCRCSLCNLQWHLLHLQVFQEFFL